MFKNRFVKLNNTKKKDGLYFLTGNSNDYIEGIIVGCELRKGITIVDAEEPEVIVLCLTRYKTQQFRYLRNFIKLSFYILKKEISLSCFLRSKGGNSQSNLKSICPFK